MILKLKLEASEDTKSETVSLADLGFTEKKWKSMSEESKRKAVSEYVDFVPEQPYWVLLNFTEQ